MSIYIDGIKMPERDGVYTIRIWGTGQIERIDGYHSFLLSWSKAVNIPPHGRLIDADALEMERRAENAKKGWHDSFAVVFNGDPYYEATYDCTEQFKELVNNAPTVIQADEPFGKSEQLNV